MSSVEAARAAGSVFTFHLTVEGDSDDVTAFHDAVAIASPYPEGSGPLVRGLREAHAVCVDEGPTHRVWKFEAEPTSVFGLGDAAFAVPQLKFKLSWEGTGDEAEVGHTTCIGGDVVDHVRCEPIPLGGLRIHRHGHADPVVLTDDSVADLRKLLAEAVPV